MPASYSMRGTLGAAERALAFARQFLLWKEPGSLLHDVQEDPRFRHRGVDLLWESPDGEVRGVEVKGDRRGRGKRYFFELVSNVEKNTPGCFLYSRADLYLYVFLEEREVHPLPMPRTREWFLAQPDGFPLMHTTTKVGPVLYTTVGAVVPVAQVQREVPGAERHRVSLTGELRPVALKPRAKR